MHHQLDKRKLALLPILNTEPAGVFSLEMIIVLGIFFHFFSFFFPGNSINDSVISVAFFSIDQKVFYWKKDLFSSRANNKTLPIPE